jgi:hypothetical protein
VAIVLLCVYDCGRESRSRRKVLPYGALTAAIGDCLIFLWVFIYILFIYPNPKVYYKPLDFSGGDDDDLTYEDGSSGSSR